MAAAEYYNTSVPMTQQYPSPYQQPLQQSPQQRPYQQSPHHRPQELQGSPVPQYSLNHRPQYSSQPPSYQSTPQQEKPSVHFAPSPAPPQQHRPSVSSSGRPSFSGATPPKQGQYLQPPPHHAPPPQYGPPQIAAQPPHMRPYMNGNQSEYSLNNGGYSSDPESRRRRRHRHPDHKGDEESSRDIKPRKDRSRSTNADGFLGAAGGGLIGDLIFPGLGTVGGAVAGWIGGKDYGKHRKHREDKLHRDQRDWEHKFSDQSHSRDNRHEREHDHDHNRHSHSHRRSPPRHKNEY